jgi:hypothetical protein
MRKRVEKMFFKVKATMSIYPERWLFNLGKMLWSLNDDEPKKYKTHIKIPGQMDHQTASYTQVLSIIPPCQNDTP